MAPTLCQISYQILENRNFGSRGTNHPFSIPKDNLKTERQKIETHLNKRLFPIENHCSRWTALATATTRVMISISKKMEPLSAIPPHKQSSAIRILQKEREVLPAGRFFPDSPLLPSSGDVSRKQNGKNCEDRARNSGSTQHI